MHPALIACLTAAPEARAIDDVAAWWPTWQALDAPTADPSGLAVAGGFAADRVGWAFASGYQAALRALLPELPRDVLAAFCVTEANGNRPRDIHTRITPQPDGSLRIDGAKRWTTLGPASTLLLIVGALPAPASASASAPAPARARAPATTTATATAPTSSSTSPSLHAPGVAGRPVLRVARVPAASPGLTLQPMPPTRFVPEVPHAQVLLHDVRVGADALLPHDGYDAYVKPFRTIEDVHVTLAVLAYLLREGRARHWPAAFTEQLIGALGLLLHLAGEDPRAASTHVVLAGALRFAHRLYADAAPLWAAANDAAAARWQRDAPLFDVAGAARELRAERAWERLRAAADR